MEIIKMGKNTGKVEIKLPNTVKKEFEKYLKSLKYLTDGDDIQTELAMASWLASFKDSEEYKNTIQQAEDKKKKETDAKEKQKAQAKADRKAEAEKKRIADLKKLKDKIAELEAKGQQAEEAEEAEAQADAQTEE